MGHRILIKILLAIGNLILLGGCYVMQEIPGDELELNKRDRIISFRKSGEPEYSVLIKLKGQKMDAAYIYHDTLFIKINYGTNLNPDITELSVPLDEIKYAEVFRYSEEATTALVATGAITTAGITLAAAIALLVLFGITVVGIFIALFSLLGL